MKTFLVLTLLFLSCNPVKKAQRVARQNPKEFAGFCAEVYPVKDSVTVYDSIRFDTLFIQGEPYVTTEIIKDTVLRVVYFPGTTKIITKTVRHDSTIVRRDFAKETELQKQKDDLITSNKDIIGQREGFKHGRNWWRMACLITWAILGVGIVWKLWLSKYFSALKILK